MAEKERSFSPDCAIPPGETLLEALEAKGMTQAELAKRTGRPAKTINEIVKGKAAITAETAIQFERVLGIPASFWTNLERNYQENRARQRDDESLTQAPEWVGQFPIKEMCKAGFLTKADSPLDRTKSLLNFFGVAGIPEWATYFQRLDVAFRSSPAFHKNPYAVAAWLRQGERLANDINSSSYSESGFRKVLNEIKSLTIKSPETYGSRMVDLCSSAGVALVFVSEIPGTHTYGATRWLSPSKALIQLSLRGKTDDCLWFTFFHEAGHIIIHGKKEFFLESIQKSKEGETQKKEEEADNFARDFLIPPREYDILKRQILGEGVRIAAISAFARKLGIAPGIVAGRLQHDKIIDYRIGNKLKTPLCLKPLDN
jgi:HTH-type transcriptional regulator / antitoxin HigA